VLLLPPDDGTALADRVETSDAAPTQEPTGATFQGGSLPAS